jgi:hypothetical protein
MKNVKSICRAGVTNAELVDERHFASLARFALEHTVLRGESILFNHCRCGSYNHGLSLRYDSVIRSNPITRDCKAGLQLGAAVVVKTDRGRGITYHSVKFPVCELS